MVDVRGDVLRPPHGTTPAAVKSNKNQKADHGGWSLLTVPIVQVVDHFGTPLSLEVR